MSANRLSAESAKSQKRHSRPSSSVSSNGSHLDLQSLHHQSPGKASPAVELEVSKELAKKLEVEVKLKFAATEQIKYLTESIQQLHIDLENKRKVIQNLERRYDIGALPSSDNKKKKDTPSVQ